MSDSNPFDPTDTLSYLETFDATPEVTTSEPKVNNTRVKPARKKAIKVEKPANSDGKQTSKIVALTLAGIILFGLSLTSGVFLGKGTVPKDEVLVNLAKQSDSPPTVKLSDKENCITWPGGTNKSMDMGIQNTPFGLISSMEYSFYSLRSGEETAGYYSTDSTDNDKKISGANLQKIIDTEVPQGTTYCLIEKSSNSQKVEADLQIFKPDKPTYTVSKTYYLLNEDDDLKIRKVTSN